MFYTISCTCDFFDQLCLVFDQLRVLCNQFYMCLFNQLRFIQSVIYVPFTCYFCLIFDQLYVLTDVSVFNQSVIIMLLFS